jgi:hypothetical protein
VFSELQRRFSLLQKQWQSTRNIPFLHFFFVNSVN